MLWATSPPQPLCPSNPAALPPFCAQLRVFSAFLLLLPLAPSPCVLALRPLLASVLFLPFTFPARNLPHSESKCIWIAFCKLFFNYNNFRPKDILGCNMNRGDLLAVSVEMHQPPTGHLCLEVHWHLIVRMPETEPFPTQTPGCPSLM